MTDILGNFEWVLMEDVFKLSNHVLEMFNLFFQFMVLFFELISFGGDLFEFMLESSDHPFVHVKVNSNRLNIIILIIYTDYS